MSTVCQLLSIKWLLPLASCPQNRKMTPCRLSRVARMAAFVSLSQPKSLWLLAWPSTTGRAVHRYPRASACFNIISCQVAGGRGAASFLIKATSKIPARCGTRFALIWMFLNGCCNFWNWRNYSPLLVILRPQLRSPFPNGTFEADTQGGSCGCESQCRESSPSLASHPADKR